MKVAHSNGVRATIVGFEMKELLLSSVSFQKQAIIVVTQPYLMMTFIWTSATRVLDGDPHA